MSTRHKIQDHLFDVLFCSLKRETNDLLTNQPLPFLLTPVDIFGLILCPFPSTNMTTTCDMEKINNIIFIGNLFRFEIYFL